MIIAHVYDIGWPVCECLLARVTALNVAIYSTSRSGSESAVTVESGTVGCLLWIGQFVLNVTLTSTRLTQKNQQRSWSRDKR